MAEPRPAAEGVCAGCCQDTEDADELDLSEENTQVRTMVLWFLANYEDPVENTPYDSAEGGYQFIHGGPYEAREELRAQFPDADEKDIESAGDLLDGRCWEWTKPSTEDSNGEDS